VEDKFGCVHGMVMAEERDWQSIEGIGKVTAKRIVEVIHKEAVVGNRSV